MRAVPMGIGGVLVLLLLSWATGVDFLSLVGGGGGGGAAPTTNVGTPGRVASSPAEEKTVDFLDAVMGDAQATWQQLLGPKYERTTLRLFRDVIDTNGCGHRHRLRAAPSTAPVIVTSIWNLRVRRTAAAVWRLG